MCHFNNRTKLVLESILERTSFTDISRPAFLMYPLCKIHKTRNKIFQVSSKTNILPSLPHHPYSTRSAAYWQQVMLEASLLGIQILKILIWKFFILSSCNSWYYFLNCWVVCTFEEFTPHAASLWQWQEYSKMLSVKWNFVWIISCWFDPSTGSV